MADKFSRPALLVLIRHAESLRNRARRTSPYFSCEDEAWRECEGTPDHLIPLTDRGLNQARQTGPKLRELYGAPDYFYHSGYRRTFQTMEGILEAYTPEERAAVKLRLNPFVRERDPGYTYEMPKDRADQLFPFLDAYWKEFGGFFGVPIGGESLIKVVERVDRFIGMLFKDRAGQKVFVATHGGTLRCFRFVLEHWDYERALNWPPGQVPENCGVTVYRADPTGQHLRLEEYNTVYWK